MEAAPIVSGTVPNVLSSRTRTESPGAVGRAINRTVSFETTVAAGARPCREVPHAATQWAFPVEEPLATPSPRAAINAMTTHTAATYFFNRFMIVLRLLWFECHSAVPFPLLRTAVTSTPFATSFPPPDRVPLYWPARSGGVGPGREPGPQTDGTCSCFLCIGFPIWTGLP